MIESLDNWKKLGEIYSVDGRNEYLISHASNPLAVHLEGDVFRVYYSGRDANNRSSVGAVDLDILTGEIKKDTGLPVLIYGEESGFYSHGISIGNSFDVGDNRYILFMGWQIRNEEHWRGDIGRIKLTSDSLVVDPNAPYMTVDSEDPVSLSYPWVMKDQGIYKMWYGSTISWTSSNGEMVHVIKYATSVDCKNWEKHGIAIPYEEGVAQAFSRPTVLKRNNVYHMWYSYRDGLGTKYRIGYSNSADGINWQSRTEKFNLNVASSGWDSEMICYPFVFEHQGRIFMLYNGNDFGKNGFGLAEATV